MTYFNKSFIQFFKDLEKNNNKEWFDANRSIYEQEIKKPFEKFTLDLAMGIKKFDPDILVDVSQSIFRINKDIRFSKDKSPYKLNRSCAISKNGKKDHGSPGYYVELRADKIGLAGGAWAPSPEHIQKIRQEISYNMKEFSKLIKAKDFVAAFGEIQGEKSKKLPKELLEDAAQQPLIYNKQFYYWREIPALNITKENLLEIILANLKTVKALNQFFRRAMES